VGGEVSVVVLLCGFVVLEKEPRTSLMLDKYITIELLVFYDMFLFNLFQVGSYFLSEY
jgi:hypothetical protein